MKRIHSLPYLMVLFAISGHNLYAQPWSGILSPTRAIDWSNVGVVGGIPTNRTTNCATLSPGATVAQINSAITGCASGGIVYLNAGTYTVSGQIFFNNKSNVTLRGAGPDHTFITWTAKGACNGLGADICVMNGDNNYSGDPHNAATWTAGYSQGTTTITLGSVSTGSINNLHVGSFLILDQLNDASDTGNIYVCGTTSCSLQGGVGNGRSGRAQNQQVTVTSISGTGPWTIGITPGIYAPNWRSSQSPGAWWSSSVPVTGDGIENLSMDHSSVGGGSGILLVNAANCWVKNVRSLNSPSGVSAHVFFYQSSHNTVGNGYFYGASGSSEGYGVDSGYSSSDNLVENNIFQHIATGMITEGSVGNVFSYNYAVDDYFGPGTWQQEDSYHHSVGDYYNLWEGNQGIGFLGDNIHGTSFMLTGFRTYWNGRDPGGGGTKAQQTNAVHLYSFNRYWNVIGCVLGTSGYHTIYTWAATSSTDPGKSASGDLSVFNLGYSGNEGTIASSLPNDTLVASTLMRWGNYDTVNAAVRFVSSEVPSGLSIYANAVPSGNTLPSSFYLFTKPSWWGTMPWPAIGPEVTGGNVANVGGHAYLTPSANCYLNIMGGLTNGGSGSLTFNANNCYTTGTGSVNPPTTVSAIAH